MEERRQLPRWGIKKEAMVWMPQTQDFSYCVIEDMHLQGMRMSFNKQLPRHQAVSMSFAIGDDFGFINIEAQVPWTREDHGRYVYGLSFTKIADEDKKKMYRYINANCYEQFRNIRWMQGTELPLFINCHFD
jgi:c-di-GMP-binding flagellar brake protein YcgR